MLQVAADVLAGTWYDRSSLKVGSCMLPNLHNSSSYLHCAPAVPAQFMQGSSAKLVVGNSAVLLVVN
jgi:hypothetical protein